MSGGPIRVLELRSVCGAGGGPEKTILLGTERTDRSRFAITVCYLRDARDDRFGVSTRAGGLGIDYVEVLERHSFDPRILPGLRTLVRSRRIDLVHAHEYKTNLLALLLAKTEGIVPLSTSHGWSGHTWRERFVYYPLDRRLLRAFPITIAVSREIRAELMRAGVPSDRVRLIRNGVDHRIFRRDTRYHGATRQSLGLSPDDVTIGAIGALEPCKRFDLLIHACAMLRPRWPSVKLLIAGEGRLAADLARRAARELPNGCVLLGHRPDVIALHHAFDVFVLSSDHEGTPNVVLEAMALETPVVTTTAGTEAIEDGMSGLVVPAGDAAALAEAIARTLTDRDRTRARVARARRVVETTLSFDARMAAVEDVYCELMQTRLGARRGSAAA